MLFHNLEDGAQADFCKEIVFHGRGEIGRNIKNIRRVEEASRLPKAWERGHRQVWRQGIIRGGKREGISKQSHYKYFVVVISKGRNIYLLFQTFFCAFFLILRVF
jgi:hypothetical protein